MKKELGGMAGLAVLVEAALDHRLLGGCDSARYICRYFMLR